MSTSSHHGDMKEVVGIFPGLGSEHQRMFRYISNESYTNEVFKVMDEELGRRFVPFDGNARSLSHLDVQLSIFAVSVCYWRLLSHRFQFKAFAGHSLGMYSAFHAAGSLGLREAVKVIVEAHRSVHEVTRYGEWAMAAIIGLAREECQKLCSKIGDVYVSNVNAATRVIVSGKKRAVEKVMAEAEILGASDVRDMGIPYPLHSPFMNDIPNRLEPLVNTLSIGKPDVPVFDHSGHVHLTREDVRSVLVGQIARPVNWRDAVLRISECVSRSFLEIGPSKVLSRLVRWTIEDAVILTAEEVFNVIKDNHI